MAAQLIWSGMFVHTVKRTRGMCLLLLAANRLSHCMRWHTYLCAWNKYLSSIRAGWQNHLNKQLHIQLLNLTIHFLLCIKVGVIHWQRNRQCMWEIWCMWNHACDFLCQVVGKVLKCFNPSQNRPRNQETNWDWAVSFLHWS